MDSRLILISTLITCIFAACPGPVALPVADVVLSNQQVMRGIPFTVGTNPQFISFMPHDYLNDTWIYNSTSAFCPDNDPQIECITYRGGEYNVALSTTAQPAPNVYATGGDPSDAQRTLGTHMWNAGWINDVLAFGNTSLPSFPIGMPSNDFGQQFDTQNNIGMGVNSTLLTTLHSQGLISGRSWSWWWGQTGASENVQMNGSIVFGGYDQAKTLGQGWTQPLQLPSENCPSGMNATITNISLNFPNGTQASITEPDEITACLQPDFTVIMTLLQVPYFESFEALTDTQSLGPGGGNGIAPGGALFNPDNVFEGSLIVQFNYGAFTVEIPNDVLAVPPQQIQEDGSIATNFSQTELLIGVTGGPNDLDASLLGRQFFSSVYVNVDYDAGTFTLWQANPTEETNLVAVGRDCVSSTVKSTPSAKSAHSGSATQADRGTNSNKPSNDSHAAASLSMGTIVGIGVGAVLGISALCACIAYCYRCHTRAKQRVPIRKEDICPPTRRGTPYFLDSAGRKLHEAFSSNVQELRSFQDPRELASESKPQELWVEHRFGRPRQAEGSMALRSPVELA